jgi:hypothetical protein
VQGCDCLLHLRKTKVCHSIDRVQYAGCLLQVALLHMVEGTLGRHNVRVVDIRCRGSSECIDSIATKVVVGNADIGS